MADTNNINDSDPYVDMDPDFNTSVEVVEEKADTGQDDAPVSLKKIFILLFLFLMIIAGGLSGFYFLFYSSPNEMVADNWNAPTTTIRSTPEPEPQPSSPTNLTASAGQVNISLAADFYQLSPDSLPTSLTELTQAALSTQASITELTMLALSAQASLTELTMMALNMGEDLTRTLKIVRKTIMNPLAPLTPNLRSSPVLYRYKIAGASGDLTSTDDDIADASTEDLTKTKSATAKSITKTDKKAAEVAHVSIEKRRKPIVFRASIPLIQMYPELTHNFNSFIVLLPEAKNETYIDISVSVKTSNEKVFKEIQDRKTFVRGAIYGILKRIFETTGATRYSSDELKKRLIKDINYILINGTVDKIYITNYLTI